MTPELAAAIEQLRRALGLLDGSIVQGPDEFYLDPLPTAICYARQFVKLSEGIHEARLQDK